MIVLGVETSCDETAAAVVEDGVHCRSSVVSSQIDVHQPYGGVVPELASRKHMEAMVPVVRTALEAAGIRLDGIDAMAVTRGPGLVGALLVGFSFVKACAYGLGIPWVGVDHLMGHIDAVFLEPDPPPFPFAALLASGGHTAVYRVDSHTRMTRMGQTRDDAAGEAYDKVSKMLGLGYPGGRAIDDLAKTGDPGRIRFPRAYLERDAFDFSFSGIKTAVNRYIQTHPETFREEIADIVSGFQEAVVDVLVHKLIHAAVETGCRHIAIAGGVAANSRLRARIKEAAARRGLTPHLPALRFCGDNAAMIAAHGYHHLRAGKTSGLSEDVYSRTPLS